MENHNFNTFSELYQTCISDLDPEQVILICNDNKITIAEFVENVKKYKWCLQKSGVKKGTRVGYSLPDCIEIYYLVIALSRIGACAVPMHLLMPISYKQSILQLFNVHIFISNTNTIKDLKQELEKSKFPCTMVTIDKNKEFDYSFYELLPDFKENEYPEIIPGADDPVFAISSSGTTGIPKFIEITQRNLVNAVKATKYFMEPVNEFKKGFTILCAFPMSTNAIVTLLGILFFGKTIIILDDFSPIRFLSLIQQYKADGCAATPAYYEALINLPVIRNYRLDSVKRIYTGMDFLPNKRLHKIKKIFTNSHIAGIGYGLAETCTVVMVWQAFKEEDFSIPTTYMTPIPGIGNEIEIITSHGKMADTNVQGEIIIRGPNVVKEYYRNPEETKKAFHEDGWFYTGDSGCKDEKGRIHLLGRMKYIIKRGGRSISPIKINNFLLKHQSIDASAVIGIPHAMYGEMIWAFIKKEKDRDLTTGDLMRYCREGLPPYMIPDHISFIDKIPKKKGVGKINNEELISIATEELKKIKEEQMNNTIQWVHFHKTVCDHLGLNDDEIVNETDIYKDIGLDSLGMVSLGMKLQAEFNVTVPLSEVSTIKTIGDLYKILNEYVK